VRDLKGKVAVVTGASRGIGKGIAEGLGEYGATVYVTGRSSSTEDPPEKRTIEATAALVTGYGGKGIAVQVDHNNDDQVRALFEQVEREQGRLDILVNNVYQIPDPPALSGGFWEHPISVWDEQCGVGLRGYYVASVLGAPMMIKQRSGLIVNISSRGGGGYVFSASYGVGKAGVDRMAQDFAVELKTYNCAALSLSPSKVKTEFILEQVSTGEMPPLDPAVAQSVRFSGRTIAALAMDENIMAKTGGIFTVNEIAAEYSVVDPDRE
jgi:NAD(P)-dependent dehydrogenase (short-subunit alcohol dehydrogenase family)